MTGPEVAERAAGKPQRFDMGVPRALERRATRLLTPRQNRSRIVHVHGAPGSSERRLK